MIVIAASHFWRSKQGSSTGGVAGKGKKKTNLCCRPDGACRPESFHFSADRKKELSRWPIYCTRSRKPHGAMACVVWVGLVGRVCRDCAFLTPPLFLNVECEISTPSSILMQPIVNCIYRVAHVISSFDGGTPMHRTSIIPPITISFLA
jgi:hypothetical protein